jgi:hypothetical protein
LRIIASSSRRQWARRSARSDTDCPIGEDTVLRAALATYGADDRLRRKAAIRIRAFPFLDIAFHLGKGDPDGVAACVDLVRRVIVDGDDPARRGLGQPRPE